MEWMKGAAEAFQGPSTSSEFSAACKEIVKFETIQGEPLLSSGELQLAEQGGMYLKGFCKISDEDGGTVDCEFHVLEHDVYKVPSLYFMFTQDDSAVPFKEACKIAYRCIQKDGETSDGADFITQEIHPFTGVPFFCVHPCQTKEVLRQISMAPDDEDNDSSTITVGEKEARVPSPAAPEALKLAAWMSVMMPILQVRVNLKAFASLRKKVTGRSKE